jgi:hypothetical protein
LHGRMRRRKFYLSKDLGNSIASASIYSQVAKGVRRMPRR